MIQNNPSPEHTLPTTPDVEPGFANRDHLARVGDVIIRFVDDRLAYGPDDMRVLDRIQQGHRLFEELTDTYNIPQAGYRPVVIGMNGSTRLAVETNHINGEVLLDTGIITDPTHKQAAALLLDRLTQYVLDKDAKDEPILTDIFKLGQYVYDRTQGDFVLVDTDPMFEEDSYYKHEAIVRHLDPWAARVLDEDALAAWRQDTADLHIYELSEFLDEDF